MTASSRAAAKTAGFGSPASRRDRSGSSGASKAGSRLSCPSGTTSHWLEPAAVGVVSSSVRL